MYTCKKNPTENTPELFFSLLLLFPLLLLLLLPSSSSSSSSFLPSILSKRKFTWQLKRGPWTAEEEQKLADYIQKHGHGGWLALPKLAGLNRCGKSCRLRRTNYLRPDIKRGKFSPEEEQTILNLHSIFLGNKWSAIATHLPGRTDNEIKNFWNTHLKKKLIQMGFDPMTHRPRIDIFAALPGLLALAILCDQSMNLQYLQYLVQSASTTVAQNNCQDLNINIPNHHHDQDFDSMGLVLDNNSPTTLDVQGFDGLMQNELQPMLSSDTNQGSSSFNNNTLLSQGENINSSPRTPLLMEGLDLPLLADVSFGGDVCSTSSCGGGTSSFWSELLLDDPFITHEFS